MNEKDVIQNFISQRQNPSVAQSIGDDCAIVNVTQGHQLVLTTDVMVEGRHFVEQSPAYLVGYKLMACNLSDIAAMGAQPKWATLNLTLKEINQSWLSDFAQGLLKCAELHEVTLVGGDTTMGDQLILSIQLVGEVPINSAILRKTASVGDTIYVTGKIGYARNALKQLQSADYHHDNVNKECISAFYQPPSRVNLAKELRDYISASIDISDGLLHELELICQSSHKGAILDLENIPVADNIDIIEAITSGDDYELLFTANSKYAETIAEIGKKYHCRIAPIGCIRDKNSIELQMNGQTVSYPDKTGYDHVIEI